MSKVERFENQRAAKYDQFVEIWIPNYHYFMEQVPKLLSEVTNKHLLVVGCGTGTEIERFVETKQGWKILGVDPSPEMIAQAKDRLGHWEEVELVEGTVDSLSKAVQYGAATLLLVLHFMEDDGTKKDLLQGIADRLEQGAPLLLLDITGDELQIEQNLQVLKALLPSSVPEEEVANRLHSVT
ncbi:MAG: class I SAM-dependent methyltransferase [Bacteroidota bacterium]